MRLCACLLAVWALAQPAYADSPSDADIAQHYFAAGREAFGQGRYEEALVAFQTAARLAPRAELDYDIGLCADRLGHRDEAIAAYERFLHGEHDGASGADVEVRLHILRGVVQPRRTQRWQAAAISMAAATVVLGAVGLGLIFNVDDRYNALKDTCGMTSQCAPSQYRGVQQRDVASKVLFGLSGAALAVDVGLWVAWARARHAAPREVAR